MSRYLRDPIAHFLLIGLILVAINQLWTAYQGEQGRTIRVSAAEIERLSKLWAETAGRLPTGQDRQDIIDQYVREEMLVREAGRLGLDEDDVIIRRRLAQKMDFLLSSENVVARPADAELESWFEKNRERFAAPERRSFVHVYFSPEKHRNEISNAASQGRVALLQGADWQGLGDPFIQKRSYAALPESEVTRLFGPNFARDIFALDKGKWSEPIGSAYGLHLVRVEAIDQAMAADFAPIRGEVLAAWQETQNAAAKQAALDDMLEGYEVVVEETGR